MDIGIRGVSWRLFTGGMLALSCGAALSTHENLAEQAAQLALTNLRKDLELVQEQEQSSRWPLSIKPETIDYLENQFNISYNLIGLFEEKNWFSLLQQQENREQAESFVNAQTKRLKCPFIAPDSLAVIKRQANSVGNYIRKVIVKDKLSLTDEIRKKQLILDNTIHNMFTTRMSMLLQCQGLAPNLKQMDLIRSFGKFFQQLTSESISEYLNEWDSFFNLVEPEKSYLKKMVRASRITLANQSTSTIKQAGIKLQALINMWQTEGLMIGVNEENRKNLIPLFNDYFCRRLPVTQACWNAVLDIPTIQSAPQQNCVHWVAESNAVVCAKNA